MGRAAGPLLRRLGMDCRGTQKRPGQLLLIIEIKTRIAFLSDQIKERCAFYHIKLSLAPNYAGYDSLSEPLPARL